MWPVSDKSPLLGGLSLITPTSSTPSYPLTHDSVLLTSSLSDVSPLLAYLLWPAAPTHRDLSPLCSRIPSRSQYSVTPLRWVSGDQSPEPLLCSWCRPMAWCNLSAHSGSQFSGTKYQLRTRCWENAFRCWEKAGEDIDTQRKRIKCGGPVTMTLQLTTCRVQAAVQEGSQVVPPG